MAKSNPDYLDDHDHLHAAKQMLGVYYNDSFATPVHQVAELLEVIAEAAVSIAESQHHLATGERARK